MQRDHTASLIKIFLPLSYTQMRVSRIHYFYLGLWKFFCFYGPNSDSVRNCMEYSYERPWIIVGYKTKKKKTLPVTQCFFFTYKVIV